MLTPELLELRKSGIGGSEAAAVVGLSRYKTPLDVYLDKYDLAESTQQNDRMYFGSKLESSAIELYERKTGKKCEIEPRMLRHRSFDWMIANIDARISGENAILECKIIFRPNMDDWGDEGTDQMPIEYLLQCAHYAAVCDVERVDLAPIIFGELKIYQYKRKETLETKLMLKESDFWHNHVLPKVPPAPQKLEDAMKLWPEIDNSKIAIADEETEQAVYELSNINTQIRELQKSADAAKTRIYSFLKDASTLVDVNGRKLATSSLIKKQAYMVKEQQYKTLRLAKEL